MSIDPYLTPVAIENPVNRSGDSAVSEGVLRALAGTKPWVRFFSVLILIGAAFLGLVAIALFVAGGGALFQATGLKHMPAGVGAAIAVVYGLLAFLYIYPGMKLWKYASRIGLLLESRDQLDLEAALNEQRAFWKFVGVIMLVFVVLYAVIFIGGLLIGGFAAFGASR